MFLRAADSSLPEDGILRADCGFLVPRCSGDLSLLRGAEEMRSPCTAEEKRMADAILRLLSDRSLRDACAENCFKKAEELSPEKILAQWETLLETVTE